MSDSGKRVLQEFRPPTKIKLALLWASLMFLYIYNDYFSLYVPGTISSMAAGRMGPLGAARADVLVAVSLMLSIPAIMIFLSAALPSLASRWLNVLLGIAYTAIEAFTFSRSAPFYKLTVVLEVAVSALIIWYSVRWPKNALLADLS